MSRPYRVTLKRLSEVSATVTIRARSQEDADRQAWKAYCGWTGDGDFPPAWVEHDPIDYDAEIDRRFRCVDCDFDTQNSEYYMVADQLWAAAGMEPHGGMLCLACLEGRIGRPLTLDDFTAMMPTVEAWDRHVEGRAAAAGADPAQIELFGEADK